MSRLDYYNALLFGLPKKAGFLQLGQQNAAAQILTTTRQRAHITSILRSLHWLPISFRIVLEQIFSLVFESGTSLSLRHAFQICTQQMTQIQCSWPLRHPKVSNKNTSGDSFSNPTRCYFVSLLTCLFLFLCVILSISCIWHIGLKSLY